MDENISVTTSLFDDFCISFYFFRENAQVFKDSLCIIHMEEEPDPDLHPYLWNDCRLILESVLNWNLLFILLLRLDFNVDKSQCSKVGKKVQFQKCKNTFFTISKMAKNQFLHQKKV